MKLSKLISGVALIVAATTSQASIVNGGFEAGLTGWNTSGLTCSGVGSNYSAATGGCYGMDSDPGAHSGSSAFYLGTAATAGGVSQSLATNAGSTYHISFWLANGAYNGVSTANSFALSFDGVTLLNLVNAPAQAYTFYEFDALASSLITTLSIVNQQTPSFWVLDDVAVTEVPEPTTLALSALALIGIAASRRRKA